MLRALLAAPVLAWAWRSPARAAPPANAGISKEAAAYQASPHDGEKCSGCAQFVPPDQCKVVSGDVAPNGWCKLFAAKPGG